MKGAESTGSRQEGRSCGGGAGAGVESVGGRYRGVQALWGYWQTAREKGEAGDRGEKGCLLPHYLIPCHCFPCCSSRGRGDEFKMIL